MAAGGGEAWPARGKVARAQGTVWPGARTGTVWVGAMPCAVGEVGRGSISSGLIHPPSPVQAEGTLEGSGRIMKEWEGARVLMQVSFPAFQEALLSRFPGKKTEPLGVRELGKVEQRKFEGRVPGAGCGEPPGPVSCRAEFTPIFTLVARVCAS